VSQMGQGPSTAPSGGDVAALHDEQSNTLSVASKKENVAISKDDLEKAFNKGKDEATADLQHMLGEVRNVSSGLYVMLR
jgi:hypothetical protein